jgi:glycosyltransferase involved in cell wall biosynthesis
MPPDSIPSKGLSSPDARRAHLSVVPASKPKTLAVLPCLDEGPRIADIIGRLQELHPDLDVLIIDDGSTDDTADAASTAGAHVVRLPFNLGYGAALQTGYKFALERGYDRVVQMDGDGQHPPEEVGALLAALDRGELDLAVGSRFLGRPCYRIPAARLAGIRFFSSIVSHLARRTITDPTSGFQAMNRRLLAFYEQDFYPYDYPDADMLLRVRYAGFRFEEVAVEMRAGPPGKSMHRGMRPLYYVYKLLLSLALTWVSDTRRGTRTVDR